MSLLRRLMPSGQAERAAQPPFFGSIDQWIQTVGGGTSVSESSARTVDVGLQRSVIWRATNKVASTVSNLPRGVRSGRAVLDPTPEIVRRPDPERLPSVWYHNATLCLMIRGAAVGWVEPDPTAPNRAESVALLHPDVVNWTERDGWTVNGKPELPWPLGQLWYVPLYTLGSSPLGLNPLTFARRTTYGGLAAAEFGTGFLGGGGHPSAILAPEHDPGKEGAQKLKEGFMAAASGTNREPVVLPQSVKYEQIQISPEDSQFIELMRFSDEELCRFFGVNPIDIGVSVTGTSLTYSNRENRQQDYLADAAMSPIVRLEEAMTELLPPGQQMFIEEDGVLRADRKARFEGHEIGLRAKFLTINEVRESEGLDPLSDDIVEEQKKRDVAETIQKVYLGVDKVVTSGEARQIINQAGADLPIPGPDFGKDNPS